LNNLEGRINTTPTLEWQTPGSQELRGSDTRVTLKLQLLQLTGSLKLCAALGRIDNLSTE